MLEALQKLNISCKYYAYFPGLWCTSVLVLFLIFPHDDWQKMVINTWELIKICNCGVCPSLSSKLCK